MSSNMNEESDVSSSNDRVTSSDHVSSSDDESHTNDILIDHVSTFTTIWPENLTGNLI